jgi:predicted transcriptional regulator of viral defense system
MKTQTFLNRKTIFDLRDFDDFYLRERSGKTASGRMLLKYYLGTGRIKQVRKGLYLSVPPGRPTGADPYLISAKMAADSVVAFHTAMQFHGKVYTVRNDYVCCSHSRVRPFEYNGQAFRAVLFPRALLANGQEMFGVEQAESQGEPLRVTSLERTMVDMLQRPDLSGGWKEVWRSLEMVEYYYLDKVIEYVELLGNSTTAAKVGMFLDQHREQLMVEPSYLERLKTLRPKSPHYIERSYKGGSKFLPDWNLVVPDYVSDRRWEEGSD